MKNGAGNNKGLNEVTLLIGGVEYRGWKSVRIDAGIDRVARTFSLEVTNRWPGNTDIASHIKHGDVAEVMIGSDLVLTGYVDATPIKYDSKSYSVGISGRSKTADLVDCCPAAYTDTQWNGVKLERVAEVLAKPYGIKFISETSTGPARNNFSAHVGETVFEVIDSMMRLCHVLATDNANGDMVFIEAGSSGRCGTALELGKNILAGSAPLDYKDVFSKYVCVGQSVGMDDLPGSGSTAAVTSDLINRLRVLVLHQSGDIYPGDCHDRVLYERAHRAGKALETDYIVSGWREQDGTLWQPNKLVRVRDGLIGFDMDMLIVGVAWVLDAEGQRTEIKVGPLDGYRTKAAKKAQPNWSDVAP